METMLTPTQRYAARVLLALVLCQAQIHQSVPLGGGTPDDEEHASSTGGGSSTSTSTATSGSGQDAASNTDLWMHDSRSLLRPHLQVLRKTQMMHQDSSDTGLQSPKSQVLPLPAPHSHQHEMDPASEAMVV